MTDSVYITSDPAKYLNHYYICIFLYCKIIYYYKQTCQKIILPKFNAPKSNDSSFVIFADKHVISDVEFLRVL